MWFLKSFGKEKKKKSTALNNDKRERRHTQRERGRERNLTNVRDKTENESLDSEKP
jgi:hypothetical protein